MHGSILLVTMPPPPPPPCILQLFSFLEVYSPPQGTQEETILPQAPDRPALIYNFFNIFFIRTKAKQHIFTTFMNVFLSLLREG